MTKIFNIPFKCFPTFTFLDCYQNANFVIRKMVKNKDEKFQKLRELDFNFSANILKLFINDLTAKNIYL